MLYMIGALSLDTKPFAVDDLQRSSSVDFAQKPIVGGMVAREFMGEGEDKITLSGQILPFRTGGLTELEMARQLMLSGQPLPVLRGDGARLGWFTLDKIAETHRDLMRDGVGFFIKHSLELTKVSAAGASTGVIGTILSLFGKME
ncbi:phage tail protein [Rhizobium sp. SSA_523]|uniref:phage tail protein n=1 Tax=Rhizobium sp. SSA_523 TaxID=2952477 RepID=UPI002091227B|nr:phage tail protein [Rhizobium sp. SSA_523]MCO5734139.1 phage tail protein [Rhizobium sp. SSA_523]WKC24776.1 phage tail protein [Rhizobium sp. SSA_523]